jgi:hypothetical protein
VAKKIFLNFSLLGFQLIQNCRKILAFKRHLESTSIFLAHTQEALKKQNGEYKPQSSK